MDRDRLADDVPSSQNPGFCPLFEPTGEIPQHIGQINYAGGLLPRPIARRYRSPGKCNRLLTIGVRCEF